MQLVDKKGRRKLLVKKKKWGNGERDAEETTAD